MKGIHEHDANICSEDHRQLRESLNEPAEIPYGCPRSELDTVALLIGGKWRASIICELSAGSKRYHELATALSFVSHRVLTYELRLLERHGVIGRLSDGNGMRPARYSLTTSGEGLNEILRLLIQRARCNNSNLAEMATGRLTEQP
jgi:DNA-binding HxlR family transcriptional regulator